MNFARQQKHHRTKTYIILVGLVLIIGFFVIRGLLVITRLSHQTGLTPDVMAKLVFDGGATLKSTSGRTNILLLGMGGGMHEGPDLTDTMMIFSLNASSGNAALLSIPRDVWSETLKDKVNSAYHYGEIKKPGGGMLLARVIAEDVVGIPIHYVLLVDFSGFKQIIDEMGGIDVQVAKAFTDTEYPIDGKEKDTCPGDPTNRCLYETIHFDAGEQHMDGTTALKYVRSRHAEGEEGSDFARGRRQQEVIIAVKNKLLHPTDWFSPERVTKLWEVADDAIDGDLTIGEIATIAKYMAKQNTKEVQRISLDSLLINPPIGQYGRYVLTPKTSWDEIHVSIKNQLNLPED